MAKIYEAGIFMVVIQLRSACSRRAGHITLIKVYIQTMCETTYVHLQWSPYLLLWCALLCLSWRTIAPTHAHA